MTPGEILMATLMPIALVYLGIIQRRLFHATDRRIDKQDDRLEAQEARIKDTRQDCVSKEDWLRESGISRKRQDKIIQCLAELGGRVNAGFEFGAVLKALVEKVDKND